MQRLTGNVLEECSHTGQRLRLGSTVPGLGNGVVDVVGAGLRQTALEQAVLCHILAAAQHADKGIDLFLRVIDLPEGLSPPGATVGDFFLRQLLLEHLQRKGLGK